MSDLVRHAVTIYLHTDTPAPIDSATTADLDALATEAEAGYSVASVSPRPRVRGRAEVVPVRVPPELKAALEQRATAETTSVSEVIRTALHAFLDDPEPDPPTTAAKPRPRNRRPTEADTCRDVVLPPSRRQAGLTIRLSSSTGSRTVASSRSGRSTRVRASCAPTTSSNTRRASRSQLSRPSASTRSPARACSRPRTTRNYWMSHSRTRPTAWASLRTIEHLHRTGESSSVPPARSAVGAIPRVEGYPRRDRGGRAASAVQQGAAQRGRLGRGTALLPAHGDQPRGGGDPRWKQAAAARDGDRHRQDVCVHADRLY